MTERVGKVIPACSLLVRKESERSGMSSQASILTYVIQEDALDEIGQAIADFVASLS